MRRTGFLLLDLFKQCARVLASKSFRELQIHPNAARIRLGTACGPRAEFGGPPNSSSVSTLSPRAKPALTLVCLLGSLALAHAASSPRLRQTFDFHWRFHLGDVPGAQQPGFADQSWRVLNVPHDYSAEGDFSSNNFSCTAYLPGGIGWYRKAFVAPESWRDKLVSIQFDGVCKKSKVWINGHYLGERPYAYSTFAYRLTPWLKWGGTNIIAVRVDHSAMDDSRWYNGSGIYRHVWILVTKKVHIPRYGVYITTPTVSTRNAGIKIQTTVRNGTDQDAKIELHTVLLGPGGKRVRGGVSQGTIPAGSKKVFTQHLQVRSPQLWSPNSPALYTAVSTVRTGRQVEDRLPTHFGIRSIRFDAQKGFFLNGHSMKFKGVCMHGDAGALGVAVPDAVLERRLRLLKSIGCNAIRTSHNPPAPEFLDYCDRLGLMVMDEAFDEWTGSKRKWLHGWNVGKPSLHPGYSEFFKQWADIDLRDMVRRDRDHPSVILWSIGNEIDFRNDPYTDPADGKDYDPKRPSDEILVRTAPGLIKVVRKYDPSRPVTAALANLPASNATGLADLLDVVGYNYQFNQLVKDLAAYPHRKFVGSEEVYGLNYYNLIQRNPRMTGQFLWAGFDYLGEAGRWPSRGWDNGLFDTCGFLKPAGEMRESLWSSKPMVYVCIRPPRRRGRFGRRRVRSDWNWAGDPRSALPVEVFSNCKTVELFLNGKSLGRKSMSSASNRVLRWRVPFKPGQLKAVGRIGGRTVAYRLHTAGQPARIELLPDRRTLAADGEDAANIELRLVDAKGVRVPNGNALCTVRVQGAGRLLAVDNGNQHDMSPLRSHARHLYHGRALAVVESRRNRPGKIEVIVTAPGLPTARLELRSK